MGDIDRVPEVRPGAADAAAGPGAAARLAGGLRAVPATSSCATQAARCMDCGIPFCHNGCPLGNLIPDWNDLVYRDRLARRDRAAARHQQLPRVHRPAVPGAVRGRVRARHQRGPPVTIKQVEVEIIDRALGRGLGRARCRRRCRPASGSPSSAPGPAGLAAAQQLTRAGHDVVVFERADRIGGLLRYGIPEFKMEKRHLDRRLEQMEAEGTEFRANANVGVERHRRRAAARVRRGRARRRRDRVARPADPGPRARRHLPGDGVPAARRTGCRRATSPSRRSRAEGKHVVIIGGGDTGADCLGTVAPPGRGVGPPVRDPAPAARRAARRQRRGRPSR